MSIVRFIFIIFLLMFVVVADANTNIPSENQVILPNSSWEPTPEQRQKALEAIQRFLKSKKGLSDKERYGIKMILENSSKYRVQFTGKHKFLFFRKVIRCNFFPADDANKQFEYWKKKEVRVLDGGFWFWQIEYDVDRDKCINFYVNGEV